MAVPITLATPPLTRTPGSFIKFGSVVDVRSERLCVGALLMFDAAGVLIMEVLAAASALELLCFSVVGLLSTAVATAFS